MANAEEIRYRLISAGGRMSQDLGLGRIAGQVLVHLYLSPREKSLDEICEELELSKASVSIAVRQLERLGMVVQVWKKGDRKNYYITAENFTKALQKGVVEFVRQKMEIVGEELDYAKDLLKDCEVAQEDDLKFLNKRLNRAMHLKETVLKIINIPLIRKYIK